jgi:8-hydroxy-5-deazaflavin:NADPH oxidoreductase
MKIAVIGSGNVGGTLGRKWREAGHDVVYGARSAGSQGPGGAPIETIPDAVADSDVVVFAVPGPAVAEIAGRLDGALAGKVVIDAANRIGQAEFNSHAAITTAAPHVRYVRAFNTLGWENFANPPQGAVLFFAADSSARSTAEELIWAIGLQPAYVGDARARGTVDALLPLWIALVTHQGGDRRLAFSIVR